MKKITLLFLAVAISSFAYAQTNNYQNGDIVNDFTVTDTDGVEHNLYAITASGKYVFLDFFFDTCGPCQQTQTYYNELHDKYGCNEEEIFVISINNGTDNDAEVIAFENTFGGPFEHAPAVSSEGGSAAVNNDFGVSAYPTYCLIGPDNAMIARDIWPIADVSTYEAAFPTGFEPEPAPCSPLGVDENIAVDFNIYPNPTDGSVIHITLQNFIGISEVKIFSILGTEVYSETFNTNDIDLQNNMASGTYLVNITTELGSLTKRLIVE